MYQHGYQHAGGHAIVPTHAHGHTTAYVPSAYVPSTIYNPYLTHGTHHGHGHGGHLTQYNGYNNQHGYYPHGHGRLGGLSYGVPVYNNNRYHRFGVYH